ncbi:hypothetical protein AB0G76_31530 [Streptomyces asoensis]|uniref:hypothetical protein n=1 Tax=Streptomyces asoensis TaxID=249586 RepID=UPI0033DAF964
MATGMLTQNWTAAWWACTGVLVTLGAALAIWQARTEEDATSPGRQSIEGSEIGSGEQVMDGPGIQTVSGSKVEGSMIQRQDGGSAP